MLLILIYLISDFFGIHNAHTRYATSPVPTANISNAQQILTIVGSTSKYSAIPPHTPNTLASTPSVRYNLFFLSFSISLHQEYYIKIIENIQDIYKLRTLK